MCGAQWRKTQDKDKRGTEKRFDREKTVETLFCSKNVF